MRSAGQNGLVRRSFRAIARLAAPLLLLAVAVSCGSESAAPPVAPDAEASTQESAQGETTDDAVVAVTGPVFETVDGGTFDLGSIEGTDTVLWFWAPW